MRVPIVKGSDGIDGWKVKWWKGKADFEVVDTGIGKTIHLKSSSASTALYREFKFDIKLYPVLRWKWKAVKLPKNGDVRRKATDDQAIQIYVMFPRWPTAVRSRLVGYIWDSNAPAGGRFISAKTSNTRYIVLRSGENGLGEWFSEERNVYEDYKELFKEEPPQAGGVSVMIDSDDTKGAAESYIGDIVLTDGKNPD
ncbi:MAG: DUF3047 domain-containing protein [Deltaproteobacteria bacterium]|nr:DUF3047 domain-containing protein [Deltaproteobacteria bacterium]